MTNFKIKQILKNDLILARLYLVVEEIQESTLKSIQKLSIMFQQSILKSRAIKSGKILVLKDAAIIAKNNVSKSFDIDSKNSYEDFKKISMSLLSSLSFYYKMEDLSQTLASFLPEIEKQYQEYKTKNSSQAEQKTETDFTNTITQTNAQEEIEEDPILNVFLATNVSVNISKNILKVLNNQTQSSKDPQTLKINSLNKELGGFELLSSDFKQRLSKDILKLRKSEFQNIVELLSQISPLIKTIRLSIGSEEPETIKRDLLKEPVKK